MTGQRAMSSRSQAVTCCTNILRVVDSPLRMHMQVVTTHSVYGRLAASMSGKFNQIFGIEYAKELGIEYAKKSQNRPTKQDCTNGDYKPVWMF
jgi:hypothetical protein